MFKIGHKINQGRRNPNAGRKKTIRHQIQAINEELLPECEAEVIRLALHSDNEKVRLEACQYIRDCVKGKPHQSQDLRVKIGTGLTADDYALAALEAKDEEHKLLSDATE